MHTCQCKGCQRGQNSGVLLKEVAAFWRCPLIGIHCIYIYIYIHDLQVSGPSSLNRVSRPFVEHFDSTNQCLYSEV